MTYFFDFIRQSYGKFLNYPTKSQSFHLFLSFYREKGSKKAKFLHTTPYNVQFGVSFS